MAVNSSDYPRPRAPVLGRPGASLALAFLLAFYCGNGRVSGN